MDYAKQATYGAVSVAAAEYAQNMYGGKNAMVSPLVTGVTFALLNKGLGERDNMITLGVAGAIIDVGAQFLQNPIASALGL
jgi:hypothetical protein